MDRVTVDDLAVEALPPEIIIAIDEIELKLEDGKPYAVAACVDGQVYIQMRVRFPTKKLIAFVVSIVLLATTYYAPQYLTTIQVLLQGT